MARDDECDTSSGRVATRSASQKSGSDAWARSMTTPSFSSSAIKRRPSAVRPCVSPSSPDEPPTGLELAQVSVKYRTPWKAKTRRWSSCSSSVPGSSMCAPSTPSRMLITPRRAFSRTSRAVRASESSAGCAATAFRMASICVCASSKNCSARNLPGCTKMDRNCAERPPSRMRGMSWWWSRCATPRSYCS